MSKKLRTLKALFAVLALATAGAVWSGCGSSDDTTGTVQEQAETQVEEGTKKAEEAIDEGVEKTKKGLEEAKEQASGDTKKKIEKAQKEAEEGIEEGTAKAEKGLEEAKEQAEKYLP
jgi:type IV pilus biogenesis protein CpaD/CtpE